GVGGAIVGDVAGHRGIVDHQAAAVDADTAGAVGLVGHVAGDCGVGDCDRATLAVEAGGDGGVGGAVVGDRAVLDVECAVVVNAPGGAESGEGRRPRRVVVFDDNALEGQAAMVRNGGAGGIGRRQVRDGDRRPRVYSENA